MTELPIDSELLRRVLARNARLGDDQPPVTVASGCSYRSGKRLVLDIDEETFGQIQAYAQRGRVSVSAAVRELVEFGLEGAVDGP